VKRRPRGGGEVDGAHLTDHEVMARVREDEPSGLAELVRRFWGPLISFTVRYVENEDHAEDIVQETFTRVWERRAHWQPTGSVSAYLHQVARRLALNETRRLRRRRHFFGILLRDRDEPRSPDEHLASDERRAAVDQAIASLPPRQHEIFVLARYHRLTHAEIAETLEISPATVSNHMTSALKSLRRKLERFAGDL
jgi:RNA polymerase sigma-70 factor (ECF subfamily)